MPAETKAARKRREDADLARRVRLSMFEALARKHGRQVVTLPGGYLALTSCPKCLHARCGPKCDCGCDPSRRRKAGSDAL